MLNLTAYPPDHNPTHEHIHIGQRFDVRGRWAKAQECHGCHHRGASITHCNGCQDGSLRLAWKAAE